MRFRDGLPYQHNLTAVRAVIDSQEPRVWESNIYMNWLSCLRDLSAPTTDARYPEAMRTRPWAMRTLNTQLASWTQLRHDTILYAKQSYTDFSACVYPTGFVEPRLEFWQRMRATASRAADRIAALHYAGTYPLVTYEWGWDPDWNYRVPISTNWVSMTTIQSNQVAHLRSFADTLEALRNLAEKELAQQCFSSNDEEFIDGLMEQRLGGVCGGPLSYSRLVPSTVLPNHLLD
jgi:hypothetical protein